MRAAPRRRPAAAPAATRRSTPLELYAEAFEAAGALDRLEAFASFHGADFYGLPRNTATITLEKAAWRVPDSLPFGDDVLVPLRAGETLQWKLKVMMKLAWPLLIALPLLAGCRNETASVQFTGPDNALTLQMRQTWFWEETVELEVVMSRQPDCHRRSRLDSVALAEVSVDVLRPEAGEYAEPILILKQGARFYAVSTKNCEMQRFKAAPEKPGARLGTFRLEGEKLKFIAETAIKPPAPAVPASPPPAAPQQ